MIFLLLPTYPISTSTVTSSSSEKKKKSAVSKTLFFSFHLRCCKNENLWWFSPSPVTTTIIWPTTDRISHSLIFERMQIKRIPDNIREFSFLLKIGTKNLTKNRVFFTSWTIWSEKCAARGRTCNKTKVYVYLYISLYENLFENGCIHIYIYIYTYTKDQNF